MNRGSGRIERRCLEGNDASMRPRFMNRGSVHGLDRPVHGGVASMRPRFMNRGSVEVRMYTHGSQLVLQ